MNPFWLYGLQKAANALNAELIVVEWDIYTIYSATALICYLANPTEFVWFQ